MLIWTGTGEVSGTCPGDSEVAGEWIFEPLDDMSGCAPNSGTDGDAGNLDLTGGAMFSTNVPAANGSCSHSLWVPGNNAAAGAVSCNGYDPLRGQEKFSILAWVRRNSAAGENLSARIFSDANSTSLADTTQGVEFRFSGNGGGLALRLNGTEVGTSVAGLSPTNGEWHHVAVVYDGLRSATNHASRNVHFYVDAVQRGVGNILQNKIVASNASPVVVGNASASRMAANLLTGNLDDVLVLPGWAPDAVGNGNVNEAILCFMESSDDIFPPEMDVPADIVLETSPCLVPLEIELGNAIAWDDCAVASLTNDAPEFFPVGTTVVTWTAIDTAGNATFRTQNVTIEPSRTGDCDSDGLTDFEEVDTWGTNPQLADTDNDGVNDAVEIVDGTNPNAFDSDGDGLSDGGERLAGTFPNIADSDDDGLPDGWEVDNGLDPLDNGDGNANNGPDADPDGDGFPNLLEFELGSPANNPDWSGRQLAYRLCHLQNGATQPGLRVDVQDALNCGGTNDARQNVSSHFEVPELMACGYYLDLTIEGSVEDQNAGYDKVSFEAATNTFYFEGNERHNGCSMATKRAVKQVLVLANSQVALRYDTVGHMYHTGGYAKVVDAVAVAPYIVEVSGPSFLRVGEEAQLTAFGGSGAPYHWESSDSPIEIDSETGRITATTSGLAWLIATDSSGQCYGGKEIVAFDVGLDAEKTLLTLKHDRTGALEVRVWPENTLPIEQHAIQIKRQLETDWHDLCQTQTLSPWDVRVAGEFQLRGAVRLEGRWHYSTDIAVRVQFPSYEQITADSGVQAMMNAAWSATLDDCTENPNRRREHGFKILLRTRDNAYLSGGDEVGPWTGPDDDAGIELSTPFLDYPPEPLPNAGGALYTVAAFHTHTPVAYRTNFPAGTVFEVGPSQEDDEFNSEMGIPGIVFDYIGSPVLSGTIPLGHPENAPVRAYPSGENRRELP